MPGPYLIGDHPVHDEPGVPRVLHDVHVRRDEQALAVAPLQHALGPLGVSKSRRGLECLGLRYAGPALLARGRLRHDCQTGEERPELHVAALSGLGW